MANIKDVAKEAEVSITTVSHVINRTRYVSPELTERVLKAIKKLNYYPHSGARSLRNNRTLSIGIIIPDNADQFFSEIVRGAEDVAFDQGYSLIIGNSDFNPEKELVYLKSLTSGRVDGIIFVDAALPDEHVELAIENGTPVAVLDRVLSEKKVDSVHLDNFHGGFEATLHLINKGHFRIGCITGPSSLVPNLERVRGYKAALERHHIPIDQELIFEGDFQIQGGYEGATTLVNNSDPPTAIFCCNDLMAIGALRALRQLGIDVPARMSLVGFDDIHQASLVEPPLTTVAQPKYEIGRFLIELIINKLKGVASFEPQTIILQPKLIIRKSTAPLRKPH